MKVDKGSVGPKWHLYGEHVNGTVVEGDDGNLWMRSAAGWINLFSGESSGRVSSEQRVRGVLVPPGTKLTIEV